jgi:hypothetical protein
MTAVNRTARIRIELKDIDPTIWRTVEVPLTTSLKSLHDVIQAVMPSICDACAASGAAIDWRPRLVRQACCPAASSISRVMTCGWEIIDRWLAFTSMVLAPIRLAMKRSRPG